MFRCFFFFAFDGRKSFDSKSDSNGKFEVPWNKDVFQPAQKSEMEKSIFYGIVIIVNDCLCDVRRREKRKTQGGIL